MLASSTPDQSFRGHRHGSPQEQPRDPSQYHLTGRVAERTKATVLKIVSGVRTLALHACPTEAAVFLVDGSPSATAGVRLGSLSGDVGTADRRQAVDLLPSDATNSESKAEAAWACMDGRTWE